METVSLALSLRQLDSVRIVNVRGRIVYGEDLTKLRQTIRDLLSSGHRRLLLDLEKVTYVDSCGLGELMANYTTAASYGAELKLLHVQKRVQKLLQITKLDTVFEVYDDESVAIGSFS